MPEFNEDVTAGLKRITEIKKQEAALKEERDKIGAWLVSQMKFTKKTGSKSFKDARYKLTLKAGVNVSVDESRYAEAVAYDPAIAECFKEKHSLVASAYKAAEGETLKLLQGIITEKPAALGVTVEALD